VYVSQCRPAAARGSRGKPGGGLRRRFEAAAPQRGSIVAFGTHWTRTIAGYGELFGLRVSVLFPCATSVSTFLSAKDRVGSAGDRPPDTLDRTAS
jgi:hypothetical protein